MAESKQIEGPAGYVGGMTPDGAEKLPTKHYKSADLAKHGGKENSIDSPACKDGYTKK